MSLVFLWCRVPVMGGINETTRAVAKLEADTVAVLACPELSGTRMRELAWELEGSGTGVYVAPTLLDVAEARTTTGRSRGCR